MKPHNNVQSSRVDTKSFIPHSDPKAWSNWSNAKLLKLFEGLIVKYISQPPLAQIYSIAIM